MEQPIRARRSRQRAHGAARLATLVAGGLVVLILVAAVALGFRVVNFISAVSGGGNPFDSAPVGSVAWKLQHGERVNLLILGYGGSENDAPYLTDTIMAVTLDPNSKRVVEASIPRDTWVTFDAWRRGDPHTGHSDKINAAFMIGTQDNWGNKLPQYTGRDGGGHLAEATVGALTGIHFDSYAAVDFKAFRDVVDALGGVDVCLSSPLDDYSYPDYHDHYVKGGIHFKAGCQHLNGERALELARSRKAIEPDQQTDFGRARRQQMLISAIKKQALSVNGIVKAPFLMNSVQGEFKTDMTLADIRAVYDFSKNVSEKSITHVALTDQNFLSADICGPGYLYTLCPDDPTLRMLHEYFASTLVDQQVLNERAHIAIANASYNSEDLGQRITIALAALGFHMDQSVRESPAAQSVIYDFSGGKDPRTAAWLAHYFGLPVKTGPASLSGITNGFLVYVGHDFASRWYGRT